MTLLIPATPNRSPDAECIICYGVFNAANPGWTHLVNREEAPHDPMHERCLRQMFNRGNYNFPHDQIILNPDSLPARTQTLFQKTQQLMTNFVCAALLGAGTVAAGETIARATATNARACTTLIAGLTGGIINEEKALAAVALVSLATTAAAVVAAAAIAAGTGTQIFNVLALTQNDQINIGRGICLGAVTAMKILNDGAKNTFAITALASGICSGIITMVRGRVW